MANNVHNFKVVLVGEGCVGKSSLILQYIENTFNSSHITTVQVPDHNINEENFLQYMS